MAPDSDVTVLAMTNKDQRNRQRVIAELKRRHKAGKPLNSGANRGDWLYAAAALRFGSWGAAIEAAGLDYSAIKIRPMTADETLTRIRELSASGDSLLAGKHSKLSNAASRLFGGWAQAIEAAGCELPDRRKWTRETIIKAIHDDMNEGLSLNAVPVIARNEALYQAGRRRFGGWAIAFDAATATSRKRPRSEISPRSVRQLRRKLGINQDEFGQRVGVSTKTVAKWEIEGVVTSSSGYIPVRQLINETESAP